MTRSPSRLGSLTLALIALAALSISSMGCTSESQSAALASASRAVASPASAELQPASDRAEIAIHALSVVTHTGERTTLGKLLDRPTAITFFYTRCDNPNKCACTVSRFGALQDELVERALDGKTRLLIFTYEPTFDTPGRLRSFAKTYDLELTDDALMIQADQEQLDRLLDELEAPVSYSDKWVTIHGMCVYLVDAHGRLALAQRNGFWTPKSLANHLEALTLEAPH